jgi:hypothetical protein
MSDVTVSDWVLICTTLLLALSAFLTPLVGDAIKGHWLRPQIRISYVPHPPGAHRTRLDIRLSPSQVEPQSVYYFRFAVENVGKTQAQKCEAVIEELWVRNDKGGLERLPHYGPSAMVWGAGYSDFININPTRTFYCDFLSAPNHAAQGRIDLFGQYVDLSTVPEGKLGLVISARDAFYSQPNRLPPGYYRFKIAIFSANADTARAVFEVDWHGDWHDSEPLMLESVPIRQFTHVGA